VYTILRRQHAQASTTSENNSLGALITGTENLLQAGTPSYSPPTETQIASWARRRAVTIDRLTGQLPAAMELLESTRAALHYGPESQSVAEVHRAAQQLLMIVKLSAARSSTSNSGDSSSSDEDDENNQEGSNDDAFPSTSTAWRLDLGSFATRDDVGRLQILLHLTESDDLAEDIPRVILPFLNQLNTETTPVSRTLRRALEGEAVTRLSWVVAFIQLEAQRPVIFETAGDLASAACAAAYACPSTEAWTLQEKLLHAAVEAIESDTTSDPEERFALLTTVAQVQGHLTAARVLTKHGLSTSLSTIREATRDDILTTVKTLLARIARAKPAESRWLDLWTDLKTAQLSGLQALPLEDVRAEMCRALLRCGQLRPAQKHLAALENALLREELVLDAARDAVYSEENPDDATVRRALDVLKTLPDSKAAVEEASFIHAAAKLRALGIEMPPLQLRQQPDKATLLGKAIAAAPLKALKDIDGLLELSKSLKTGLKKAQVLSLIAEAALILGHPRLAEDVVKQLAYEGSSEGWQIAARVAMEEPCSSEAERRRLLAYAMRFAPAGELDGQLHCWQASDAGAAGDSEVWSILDQTDASSAADIVDASYIQPLKDALDTLLLVGSSSAEDRLLAWSCLNTLGVSGLKQWVESVEMQRGGLDPAALRQVYIVSIAAASMQILVATQADQASALEQEDTSRDAAAAAASTTTTTAAAVEKETGETSSASSIYRNMLSLSPQELLSTALQVFSTAEADRSKNEPKVDVEYLKALVLDVCQRLVSCSDAQRVAQLLPGHHSAENWMEGGAEVQRSVVLQIAASSGRGDGDHDNDLLGTPAEDIPTVSGQHVSLEQALTLAERCGVEAWEVQLAYAVAVLTRSLGHHRGQSSQTTSEHDVAKVWSSLIEIKPQETVSALLRQVYSAHVNNATTGGGNDASSERAEVAWLVWLLQLCGECFQQCAATSTSSTISAEEYSTASGVVDGLAEAISALNAACPSADVTAFLDPTMHVLKERYLSKTSSASSGDTISIDKTLNAAVIEQLLEHCDSSNVAALAFAVDALAQQHAVLLNGSYPATSSTVYVVTLCKELSALAMTEGVDSEQKSKLEHLFHGTSPADGIATATFACLNGPPPVEFPSELPFSVFLSPHQSLAVLESALTALNSSKTGRSIEEEQSSISIKTAALPLEKERVRLTILLQIESTCQNDLLEHQVQDLQTLIPQLQQEEEIEAAATRLLMNFLSSLFSDGCSIAAITNIAEACKEIGSWLVEAVEEDEIVVKAAEHAVNNALGALLQGEGASKQQQQPLSVGDAVQNLYGVIRSLDTTTSDSSTHDIVLETARSKVWSLLQTHAAQHQSGNVDTASAEAHLQVLQMLGSLGSSMWQGWQPVEGTATLSTTGATYKHAEALLHSRVAAALAASWPSALIQVAITPEDFSSLEATESALMKLLETANTVEQMSAVVVLLSEVLQGASFATPSAFASPSENIEIIHGAGGEGVDPLHRVWARCLTALLTQGSLDTVTSALDGAVSSVSRHIVAETEAEALVAAADATLGTVAAAAVALLVPFKRIQQKEWAKIVALQSGDDLQGLPGLVPLIIAAVHQQDLLPDLARNNPGVFKQLCRALLEKDDVAFFAVPRGGIRPVQQLPPRTGLAVAIAAQLVSSSGNLSAAAAWVAMQHAGTHAFLRIMDSGSTVLLCLLRTGAKLKRRQGGVEEDVELEPAVRAVLGAGMCAEEILKRMPEEAAAALEKLDPK
jgi:hypothetical protein